MAQPLGHFGYQNVRIIKATSLGVGSYGAVYRALCDELPCAAKIIHPTLFETHDPGTQKIMERFEQECQFLSSVRHPHIVQYVGVSRDPDSGLPVLLMELMDSSLTQFLEKSKESLPYHIQVDLCHDIALALTHLHANGIIHRDLSSNNVLLIGPGNRAKVTDFGMSKLADANHRMTPMTMCPGTQAYMPPEALDDPPVYTDKLDCFSFGVLDIQILTRQFPDMTKRFKTIEIDDPRFPTGQIKVPVPEVERHQSHIEQVDPAHPLLPVALDCLKDREKERPSAQELCHCLAALKEDPQYGDSVQQAQRAADDRGSLRVSELQEEVDERNCEIERLQEQNTQQTERLRQQVREKNNLIKTNERQIRQQIQQIKIYQNRLQEKDAENQKKLQDKEYAIETKKHIIGTYESKLIEKEYEIASKEKQIQQLVQVNEYTSADFQHKLQQREETVHDLEKTLAAKDQQIAELQRSSSQLTAKLETKVQNTPLRLNWRKSESAPCKMEAQASLVNGAIAFFNPYNSSDLYTVDSEDKTWSAFPGCPYRSFGLAVVNDYLTTIGGENDSEITNKILSLNFKGEWAEHFPPMPTQRYGTVAVCSRQSLIVAGGRGESYTLLDTVEVMNTETLQWSTASSLPFPLIYASATICQDRVYLMGYEMSDAPRSVLFCSVGDLLQSQDTGTVWHQAADLPVHHSTCATLCGKLLAVGGKDDSKNHTTAIHQYFPVTNSWEVISHMYCGRSSPLVAVLPSNELMVVGGWSTRKGAGSQITDAVEIATIQ